MVEVSFILKKWPRNSNSSGPRNRRDNNDQRNKEKPECSFMFIGIGDILFCNSSSDRNQCNGDNHSYRVLYNPETGGRIFHHSAHATCIANHLIAPVADEPLN